MSKNPAILNGLPSKATRLEYLLLMVIILLAAGLRFYKLGEWSLWGDEAFSLGFKEDGFNYSFLRRSLAIDLIHWTTGRLGASEWTGRLAPAVIGIVTIPILYFPIKRAFNARVALMTSLLIAISTWHLYWSQNVRFYTLLYLFYSLGTLLFHIGLEEDRPWYILCSLAMYGLSARESLTALFFVPVILVYLASIKAFAFEPPPGLRWRNLLLFFGPMVLVGAFFAGPYLLNLGGWFTGFGRINNSPAWLFPSTIYYIGLPAMIVSLFGFVALFSKRQCGALFMLVGGALPFLLLMGLSSFQYTATRYIFMTLTCWLVLASLAVDGLWAHMPRKAQIFALGMLALLVAYPVSENYMYFNFNNGNRENWKGAFAFVQERKASDDLIVAANQDVSQFYLAGERVIDFEHWNPGETRGARRVWVIEDMTILELMPDKHDWLREHANEAGNFDVKVWARNFYLRVYYYDAPVASGERASRFRL